MNDRLIVRLSIVLSLINVLVHEAGSNIRDTHRQRDTSTPADARGSGKAQNLGATQSLGGAFKKATSGPGPTHIYIPVSF